MGSFEAFVELLGGDANFVKALDVPDGGLAVIVAEPEMVDISSLIDVFGKNKVHFLKYQVKNNECGVIGIDTSQGPLLICDTTLW